jgi:hypothetical protein
MIATAFMHLLRYYLIKYIFDYYRWTSMPPLRTPRAFGILTNLENKLYIIGGAIKEKHRAVSIQALDVWDPENKEWKLKTEMKTARHGMAIGYLGDYLYYLLILKSLLF